MVVFGVAIVWWPRVEAVVVVVIEVVGAGVVVAEIKVRVRVIQEEGIWAVSVPVVDDSGRVGDRRGGPLAAEEGRRG